VSSRILRGRRFVCHCPLRRVQLTLRLDGA
jgi:hypothetical protein